MEKSLTWVKLDQSTWLLVCVGYTKSLSFKNEKEIRSKKIYISETGVIQSSSTYTWRTYSVWKSNELTSDDKKMIEDIFNENQKG